MVVVVLVACTADFLEFADTAASYFVVPVCLPLDIVGTVAVAVVSSVVGSFVVDSFHLEASVDQTIGFVAGAVVGFVVLVHSVEELVVARERFVAVQLAVPVHSAQEHYLRLEDFQEAELYPLKRFYLLRHLIEEE